MSHDLSRHVREVRQMLDELNNTYGGVHRVSDDVDDVYVTSPNCWTDFPTV